MTDNPVSSQQYKCPRCGAEPGEPCTDTLGKPRRIDHLSRRRLKMWRVTIDTIFEVAAPDARTAREDAFRQLGNALLPALFIATAAGEIEQP